MAGRKKAVKDLCGKQSDASGHDVLLDVEENTRKTTYIEIAKNKNPVIMGEDKQLRSVVGRLSWIARQARPDILYRVSPLQSSIKGATISTLKEANNVLELAINRMDLLRYKSRPFNLQEFGELKSKSQQGWIHFLVPLHHSYWIQSACEYDVMVVSFSSGCAEQPCQPRLTLP